MSGGPNAIKRITQFGHQAYYLAERQNPYHSPTFKFVIQGGQTEAYVKRMAPKKYWDALIPKTDAIVLAIGFETQQALFLWKSEAEKASV